MKRGTYESELDEATHGRRRWRYLAFALVGANVLMAMTMAGMDKRQETILVPPTLQRTVWVKGAETSPEYLEEMTRYFASLLLNVTPKSVDDNISVFLRYVAPKAYGDVKSDMDLRAAALKHNELSTAFYPVSYATDTATRQVVVDGDYLTIVGKKLVSTTRRSWRFGYAYAGGRLWVTEFVEVNREHPFDKTIDDSAAADPAVER